jgi:dienelactone hydrolase
MFTPGFRSAALAAAAFLVAACAASSAGAQKVVTSFDAASANGAYKFASATSKTLGEIAKGVPGQPADIVGHLFLPKGNDKVPAVILVHGSGGIYSAMTDYWPKQFNAVGIAVFSLDTFGPRGVKSTAEDQTLVPFAADIVDTFSALKLLASHPRVDARRIAVMGFSRGGTTAWRTAIERVNGWMKLPDGLRFAAHIPVYAGGCNGLLRFAPKAGVFGKAPMLWLHGEADDYSPIGPCRDYAAEIGKLGTPVEFVALKGAHHKFDSDDTRLLKNANLVTTIPNCPYEFDVDSFAVVDRSSGQRLAPDAIPAATAKCRGRGASVQGNKAARDEASRAAVTFLRKVFALGS